MTDQLKQCSKCGEWKPLDDFNKGKGPDGRHYWCKPCVSAYQKSKNNAPAMDGTKVCTQCGEEKPVTKFNKDKRNHDGRRSLCKSCESAYQKSRNFEPVMVGTKVCQACGVEQPVSEFYKSKDRSDGRSHWCKACQTAYNKSKNNKPVVEGTKVCSGCGVEQPVTEFNKNKASPDGRYSWCKSCTAAHYKEWASSNPEKRMAKRQRRRAREAGVESDWTHHDMLLTMDTFGTDACPYCGGPLENPHWDHFIPLDFGGPSVLGNLVLVCVSCNLRKGSKMPEDFLPVETYEYVASVLAYLEQGCVEIDYQVLGVELFG